MTAKEMYKHTQIGWITIISIVIGIGVFLGILLSKPDWVGFLAAGILLVCIILSCSLTVIVDDDFVRIRFGLGLIRKNFKLSGIKSCAIVRNKWWYGWGIRWTPKGLLFNVSGLDAVELTMNDGKIYRIGTDEPQELTDIIQSKLTKEE
jgi:hypothetical protein